MQADDPLDITKVLEYYGATRIPQREAWGSMKCLFHEDRAASASVSVGKGAYMCHACDAKGDAITLIMWKESLDYNGAVDFYTEVVGASYTRVRRDIPRIRRRPLSQEPVDYERGQQGFSSRIRRKPFAGS